MTRPTPVTYARIFNQFCHDVATRAARVPPHHKQKANTMSDNHTEMDDANTVAGPPATADARRINPFVLFRQRNSGGGGFFKGDLVKLDHNTGEFFRVRGEAKTLIEVGERFIVNPHELTDTWVKFINGKLVERKVYRTVDGEMAPERAELGDNDEASWPFKNGKAKDPWARQLFLPMKGDDGAICAYSATGQSAIAEIGELVGMYGSADRHGKFPVVELETRNFESQHGSVIYVPVFRLVDWEFWEANTPAPEVQPVPVPPPPPPPPKPAAITKRKADTDRDDLSDTIPF